MQIYIHFIDDDLWYPYEAYANIGIAMIPGFFLFGTWLIWYLTPKPHCLFTIIMLIVYAGLTYATLYEAEETKRQLNQAEDSLEENFKNTSDKS